MKHLPRFPSRGVQVTRPPAVQAKATIPTLTYPRELFWDMPGNPPDAPSVGRRRAIRIVSLIFACLTFRATKLSEAPVWIAEEDDDGEHMLEGEHELSALLEQPNPDMDMGELLTLVSLYLDTTGSCLLVKNQNRRGAVGSMYPYAGDEFAVEPSDGRLFGTFRVQTLTGYRTLGPDDVIYLRCPGTEHVLSTVAPIDAALEHVNIGQDMRRAVRAAMRNAVRPSAIFRSEGQMGEDVYERLSQEIKQNWAGTTNNAKSMLLEGINEAKILEYSLKNLELGPIQDDVEAAVCQVFQVHPLIVGAKFGISENAGFADSIRPAMELFYDVSTIPNWTRIARKFTQGLLRPIDENPRRFIRFDLSKVRALQPDMTEKIAQAAAAKDIWTEAEQREHTGKEGGAEELPSERAQRVAEETAALALAGAGDDEEEDDEKAPKKNGAVNGKHVSRISRELIRDLEGKVVAHEITVSRS